MLIEFKDLVSKYNMHITGVIHVGAHTGEEAEDYSTHGISNVWWIEGNPGLMRELARNTTKKYGHNCINALVTDVDHGERKFNITNINSLSSSVLEFGTHPSFSPEIHFIDHPILETRTIDSLVEEYGIKDCNMLNMDLQGAEMMALQGATKLLPSIDYVYTEVNTAEVYIGCAKLHEIDAFLSDFDRVETEMQVNGWGDALLIRRGLL
jgi:FkbM family methyltransferase